MTVKLYHGDCRQILGRLPEASVHCVVTSPPYWGLRDYGTATWEGGDPACKHEITKDRAERVEQNKIRDDEAGVYAHPEGWRGGGRQESEFVGEECECGARRVDSQLGLEATPEEHVERMVGVFREVRRVLRGDGVVFLNYGDSYVSSDAVRRGAQRNGTGDKEPRDSQERDSVCPGLCDGCSAALSTRSDHNTPLIDGVSRPGGNEGRHTDASGPGLGENAASPRGAPASTMLESSRPLQDLCSHCANCGACLSVLRSSSRDARLCGRRALYKRGTASLGSVSHSQDMDASGSAWGYSTMADLKSKDLVGMPWRVAFGLQADGWYLRSDIIWAKPNPMPESVTDRPTKSHEHVFLLAKSHKYYYNADAVREAGASCVWNTQKFKGGDLTRHHGSTNGAESKDETVGRNLRDVWTIATHPYPGAHFATFPPKLVEPCIKAGCPEDGTVLDPFGGAGTVGLVADKLGRDAILIELNEEYADMARKRIYDDCPMFAQVEVVR